MHLMCQSVTRSKRFVAFSDSQVCRLVLVVVAVVVVYVYVCGLSAKLASKY